MQTLLKSSRYSKFIRDRDQALEQIHQNAQTDIARLTYTMLAQIENLTASASLKTHDSILAPQVSHSLDLGIRDIMTQFFPIFARRVLKLRRSAFLLAYAGEQEAIGRATQRRADIERGEFAQRLKEEMSAPTLLGDLDKRVWLALMNLRRRIMQAFDLAVAQNASAHEIVEKVKNAFPKIEVFKRAPKALVKVKSREADGDPDDEEKKDWFDFQFIDDGDWNLMVDAYTATELPPNRFDTRIQYEGGIGRYAWEMEQESTEDFVRSVRSGQVKGAEDLGVKEFVWIAVIDDKTCEDCCLPRNGKTTSEIEEFDDECGATVPPAHMNCRCNIGPVASTKEVEGPDWTSFNEWLEPKSA